MIIAFDWAIVLDFGVGAGVLLMGIGVVVATIALAKTLGRVNVTLDEVDKQIAGLGTPVGATLEHVEGIAGTADTTLARLGVAVGNLEGASKSVSDTATLAKDAISPAIVNVGATLTGISAGLRRLVLGKSIKEQS